MLGKLLKHEYKITSRYFIPMYIAIGVMTLLLKLSFLFSENSIFMSIEASTFMDIVQGLLITVYVIVLVGTAFLSVFFLVKRYYSNMFGDEGYLTHTLPVTGNQLLNSKLICSFTWILSLIPVALLSFLLLFAGTDIYFDVSDAMAILMEEARIMSISGFSVGLLVAELIACVLIGYISALLSYYLAITLGQHFMGDHRLLGSIIFYFVLSIISSAISSVFTNIVEQTIYENIMVSAAAALFQAVTIILGIGIVINLILIVVYYLITNYLLTKKLNLY